MIQNCCKRSRNIKLSSVRGGECMLISSSKDIYLYAKSPSAMRVKSQISELQTKELLLQSWSFLDIPSNCQKMKAHSTGM
mmetsp:Transcript_14375/g.20186  ORF Transcript_14375/g.20186 Transcript_14375/m.20186 type:complete len:80 (+) Transcript_14375:309-548(+)